MPATATQNGLLTRDVLENHPFVPRHIGQDLTSPFLMGWTSIDPDFDVYEAYISGWPIHHCWNCVKLHVPRSSTLLSLTTIWMPCRLQVGNSRSPGSQCNAWKFPVSSDELKMALSRTSRTVSPLKWQFYPLVMTNIAMENGWFSQLETFVYGWDFPWLC
jgi:hypothetical protein